MAREYKANEDITIRSAAMNAIALSAAYNTEIILIYREHTFKVNKEDSVNKIVKEWKKIKNTPEDL